MTTIDLARILENISHSMGPVQRLITGIAYVLGIILYLIGLGKLKKIIEEQRPNERVFIPMVCFGVGTALLYFPTFLEVMSNTVFGVGNVLEYTSTDPFDYYAAMVTVIRTAGAVWFVRGCVLLVNASEPGKQQGFKGMVYLSAGILSINYYATVGALDYSLDLFIDSMGKLKEATGY